MLLADPAMPGLLHSIDYPPETGGFYEPLEYECCTGSGAMKLVCYMQQKA